MRKLTQTSIFLGSFLALVAATPVASASAATIAKYSQATASWSPLSRASSYNIYFRSSKDAGYVHGVAALPSTSTNYNIRYLARGSKYLFRVSAINASGIETWLAPEKSLKASPQK